MDQELPLRVRMVRLHRRVGAGRGHQRHPAPSSSCMLQRCLNFGPFSPTRQHLRYGRAFNQELDEEEVLYMPR